MAARERKDQVQHFSFQLFCLVIRDTCIKTCFLCLMVRLSGWRHLAAASAPSQTNCRSPNEGNTPSPSTGSNARGLKRIMRCNEEGMAKKKKKKVIGSFRRRRNEQLISLNVSGDESEVAARCGGSGGLRKN